MPRRLYVRVLSPWANSEEMFQYVRRFCDDGKAECWQNLCFRPGERVDFWVIWNHPLKTGAEHYEPRRTVLLQMEPASTRRTFPPPFAQPDPADWWYVHDTERHHNNLEWWLDLTYRQLLTGLPSAHKSEQLSAVLSDNYHLPGHQARLDFCFDHLAPAGLVHLYGRLSNPSGQQAQRFRDSGCYRGELPYRNKNRALLPYRYTFAAENCRERNYFTEKLVDGILAECLTFYYGCPNIQDFLDPDAYVVLTLEDPAADLETIRRALREDWYSQRLPALARAKHQLLTRLTFAPLVQRLTARPAACAQRRKTEEREESSQPAAPWWAWIPHPAIPVARQGRRAYLKYRGQS